MVFGPIWMEKAKCVAQSFGATPCGERSAQPSVYVILLHDPSGPGRWGLYVGQTSRNPDLRFDQHKDATRRAGLSYVSASGCSPS
jgi:hypothetical protein